MDSNAYTNTPLEGQGFAQGQAQNMPVPDGETRLPRSPYAALEDHIRDRGITDEAQLMFTLGVQHGIGLGIHNTREAILNEMTHEGTCFGRAITLHETDQNHLAMQHAVSAACARGFDLRVALRTADRYIDYIDAQNSVNVADGLTLAVPGNGPNLIGSNGLINDNQGRADFWYATSRIIPNSPEAPGLEAMPFPQVSNDLFNQVAGNDATLIGAPPNPGQVPGPAFSNQAHTSFTAPYMPGNQTMAGNGMRNSTGAPGPIRSQHQTAFGNTGKPSGSKGRFRTDPLSFHRTGRNPFAGSLEGASNMSEDLEMDDTGDDHHTAPGHSTPKKMLPRHTGSGRRRGSGTKRPTKTRRTRHDTSSEDDSDGEYVQKSTKSSVTAASQDTPSTRTRSARKRLTLELPSEDESESDTSQY